MIAIIVIFVIALVFQQYRNEKHVRDLEARLQGENVLPPAINSKTPKGEKEEVKDPIVDLDDAIANPEILKNIIDNNVITAEGINPIDELI